jgi:hypothetical protein
MEGRRMAGDFDQPNRPRSVLPRPSEGHGQLNAPGSIALRTLRADNSALAIAFARSWFFSFRNFSLCLHLAAARRRD